MGKKKKTTPSSLSNVDPLFLMDYWTIIRRMELGQGFNNRSLEENQEICGKFARESLFTMKLAHSPFFWAQMMGEIAQNPSIWRELRKKMREYAIKYHELRSFPVKLHHNPAIRAQMEAHADLHKSNIITWGTVLFGSPLIPEEANLVYLEKLYEKCQETGKLEWILPIVSCILEKLTKRSMDFIAFGTVLGEDHLSDYFMYYKIRYTLEKMDHSIMEWLFTCHYDPKDLDALELSLHLAFTLAFSDQMGLVVENLEDIGKIDFEEFSLVHYVELNLLILLLYWDTLSEKVQLQRLNQWPTWQSIYTFMDCIIFSGDKKRWEHVDNILDILTNFGYPLENWNYLVRLWNEFLSNKKPDLLTDLDPTMVKYLKLYFDTKQSQTAKLQLKVKIADRKNISNNGPEFQKFALQSLDCFRNLEARFHNGSRAMYQGDLMQTERLFFTLSNEEIARIQKEAPTFYQAKLAYFYYYTKQWQKALDSFIILREMKKKGQLKYQVMITSLLLFTEHLEQFYEAFEDLCVNHSFQLDTMKAEIRDLYWDLISAKGIDYFLELLPKLIDRNRIDKSALCIDMGHIVADLGFFKHAKQIITTGLSFNPPPKLRGALLNNLGTILVQEGLNRDAIPIFEEAIQNSPNNGRFWLNLGKTYEFIGEYVKANNAFTKAQEFTTNVHPSSAEIACTTLETSYMRLFAGFQINYNAIMTSDVALQFQTADKFYMYIFPQNPEIQDLASSIFLHYGNGIELLYHQEIASKFIVELQNKYGSDLRQISYDQKRTVPKELQNLLYNNHIGHKTWGRIFDYFINPFPKKYLFDYSNCLMNFSADDLDTLKKAIIIAGEWRNPSSHGTIINFELVKQQRALFIINLNKALEVLSKRIKN